MNRKRRENGRSLVEERWAIGVILNESESQKGQLFNSGLNDQEKERGMRNHITSGVKDLY